MLGNQHLRSHSPIQPQRSCCLENLVSVSRYLLQLPLLHCIWIEQTSELHSIDFFKSRTLSDVIVDVSPCLSMSIQHWWWDSTCQLHQVSATLSLSYLALCRCRGHGECNLWSSAARGTTTLGMSLGPSFGRFKVLMDGNNGYLVGFDSVLLRSQCLARRMSCRCGSMSFTSHLSQSTFWQACATTLGCSKTALRILFKEAGIDWLRSPGRQVFDKLIHNLFLIGVCSQAPCLSIMRLVTSARAATSQSTRVAGNMMRMVGWSSNANV